MLNCLTCDKYGKGFERCVASSWLWGRKNRNNEYAQRYVLHRKQPQTEQMKLGEIAHQKLAFQRGVIEQASEIFDSLVKMKRTVWSGMLCSPVHGYRGRPDAVISQLKKVRDGYCLEHFVIEDKKHPIKRSRGSSVKFLFEVREYAEAVLSNLQAQGSSKLVKDQEYDYGA